MDTIDEDVMDLMHRVKSAAPGTKIVYHTGRAAGGPFKEQAMRLQGHGLVNLVQRPVAAVQPGRLREFEYLMVRTRAPWKKGALK